MKIAIGCDHGALALKNTVVEHLTKKGYEVNGFTGSEHPDHFIKKRFVLGAVKCIRAEPFDKFGKTARLNKNSTQNALFRLKAIGKIHSEQKRIIVFQCFHLFKPSP